MGLSKSKVGPNMYFKIVKNQPLILVLYVDVLFLTRKRQHIVWCKRELTYEFKDSTLMHYFLEVYQRKDEVFLLQRKHTIDVLQRFGMMDCKSMTTPMVFSLKKLQ